MTEAPLTARARVRQTMVAEIKQAARAQVATAGAAGLSLRLVCRDLGMSSSAIYRYFASRDELLTALILDGYDAIGAAAEDADAASGQRRPRQRFAHIAAAVRSWAYITQRPDWVPALRLAGAGLQRTTRDHLASDPSRRRLRTGPGRRPPRGPSGHGSRPDASR